MYFGESEAKVVVFSPLSLILASCIVRESGKCVTLPYFYRWNRCSRAQARRGFWIFSLTWTWSQTSQESSKRVVGTLLTLMDGMDTRSRVVVLGATNRPNALVPFGNVASFFIPRIPHFVAQVGSIGKSRSEFLLSQLVRRYCRYISLKCLTVWLKRFVSFILFSPNL